MKKILRTKENIVIETIVFEYGIEERIVEHKEEMFNLGYYVALIEENDNCKKVTYKKIVTSGLRYFR